MITLDTSAILAFFNAKDQAHSAISAALKAERPPYLIPAAIVCEASYFIQRRLGAKAIDVFLENLQEGRMQLECGEEDFPRIRELVARYADMPLGFADAGVVACAERNGGRVLTLDTDFKIVEREGSLTVLP